MQKIITFLAILALYVLAKGQNPSDWTGFEFEKYDKSLFGDYTFYELTKDYKVSLPYYFLDNSKLPKSCNGLAGFYHNWASELPLCKWDFIHLDTEGVLTIKRGYRWDGATNGTIDKYHNHRSSLLHDAIYDLMRLELLAPDNLDTDTLVVNFKGYHNRKMADMIHYMIAMEDGDTEKGAKTDYFFIRTAGWPGPRLTNRVRDWKYHIAELSASYNKTEIVLSWVPNNLYTQKENIEEIPQYHIYRNSEIIGVVDAYQVAKNSSDKVQFISSYTDTDVEKDQQYTYQLKPANNYTQKYDWSNKFTINPNTALGALVEAND